MGIKGIILDFGGTLDTGGDHWSTVIRDGWNKAGVVADDALFREAYVFGEQGMEKALNILPTHTFSDILNMKLQLELQYLAQNGHFPPQQIQPKAAEIAEYCYGVAKEETAKIIPILEELEKKYPMVMVSNFYGNLDTVLEEFGLSKLFKKVIESAKVKVRKPDTAIMQLGIKALGMQPAEVLVVGDSIKNDIEPAKKLGCHTLLLNGRKWGEDGLTDEEIDTIENLDEILGFLEIM
ncbi:MAG: HAD family hydrolase [Muribaculaceae bacterium]|nr:HAD family hydrolase [Muribaculaceae bacterium]